jgi:hypothetical protein
MCAWDLASPLVSLFESLFSLSLSLTQLFFFFIRTPTHTHTGPLPTFDFDAGSEDAPLQDDARLEGVNIRQRIEEFVLACKAAALQYNTVRHARCGQGRARSGL